MTPEIGELAADFMLRDQDNQPVRLSAFRGHKNVVLLFYPLTFTRVCQGELIGIRDELASFANDDTVVLAVSVDSVFAHKVWASELGLRFPLLADFWPHGGVATAYGVFDEEMGVALRGTFVIDKAGIVRYRVINAIPDARDQAEYAAALASL